MLGRRRPGMSERQAWATVKANGKPSEEQGRQNKLRDRQATVGKDGANRGEARLKGQMQLQPIW